jgi:Uncharacterized protein conserved in bacteria
MRLVRLVLTVLLAPPLFLGATLCAGAAAAAHMGRESLRFDILAHFAPFWLTGGLLAVVGALLFRGYVRALIFAMGLVAAGASVALMAPEYLRDAGPKAPPDAPEQLKVVQLNVWSHNEDPAGALGWAFSENPDLIILEETSAAVRERAAVEPGWYAVCDTCEVMILSRRPPVRDSLIRLAGPAPGPLTRAIFEDERGPFAVIGVHHAWPTDSSDQQAQEAAIAEVIARSPRERTILAGDFNSAPWSFSRRRWDAEFGLIRRDRGLFSWPAQPYKQLRWLGRFPFLPIDHVYAGSGWATVSVRRGPKLGSDHYPIVMILSPASPR